MKILKRLFAFISLLALAAIMPVILIVYGKNKFESLVDNVTKHFDE